MGIDKSFEIDWDYDIWNIYFILHIPFSLSLSLSVLIAKNKVRNGIVAIKLNLKYQIFVFVYVSNESTNNNNAILEFLLLAFLMNSSLFDKVVLIWYLLKIDVNFIHLSSSGRSRTLNTIHLDHFDEQMQFLCMYRRVVGASTFWTSELKRK